MDKKKSPTRRTPASRALKRKARLLALAGDETRMRVLCVLLNSDRACVSDIAKALGMSVASVSHHLQLLARHGIAEPRREGKQVCYRLGDNQFVRHLKSFICGPF